MTKRRPYFDYLRGAAIMMVVAIHTYVQPTAVKGFDIEVLLRQVLNCAVPLFLAISGYFCYQKSFAEGGSHKRFLMHQVPKIYIPTFLWSLPLLVVALYKGKSPLGELILMMTCGYSIYYFIVVTI